MLKKSVSAVLAALRGSTYRNVRLASSLTAALLTTFLSILRDVLLLSKMCRPVQFRLATECFCSLLDRTMPNHADENAFDMKRV